MDWKQLLAYITGTVDKTRPTPTGCLEAPAPGEPLRLKPDLSCGACPVLRTSHAGLPQLLLRGTLNASRLILWH